MWQVVMRSMGKKSTQKQILASPEEYFTDDVMEKLDAIARETLHMDEFIKQCETFDSITCQSLIDIFEESENKERIENFGRPNFTQVNLSQEKSIVSLLRFFLTNLLKFLDLIRKVLRITLNGFLIRSSWKKFRSKNMNLIQMTCLICMSMFRIMPQAKRYLAFLCYLNDDFFGGETDFPYHKLTVRPKTGTVLVFPPTCSNPTQRITCKRR